MKTTCSISIVSRRTFSEPDVLDQTSGFVCVRENQRNVEVYCVVSCRVSTINGSDMSWWLFTVGILCLQFVHFMDITFKS